MFWKPREIFRSGAADRISSPDDLDAMIRVVAPRDWIPVAVIACLMIAAVTWSVFGRIPVRVTARGVLASSSRANALVPAAAGVVAQTQHETERDPTAGAGRLAAVAYLPAEAAAAVRPGMPAHVAVDGVERQRFGAIAGAVSSVSGAPGSLGQAVALTGSADRARDLVGAGPSRAIVVALETDAAAASGYRWSSSRGPEMTLDAGVPVSVRIIVEKRRPLTYVLPFLRERRQPE